jgi:hypothetical protein
MGSHRQSINCSAGGCEQNAVALCAIWLFMKGLNKKQRENRERKFLEQIYAQSSVSIRKIIVADNKGRRIQIIISRKQL